MGIANYTQITLSYLNKKRKVIIIKHEVMNTN